MGGCLLEYRDGSRNAVNDFLKQVELCAATEGVK